METQCITFRDKRYPHAYRGLPDVPEQFYYRGDISLLSRPSLAIIGTRNPSERGIEIARWVTEYAVEHGYVTVAGLALGIDGIVHAATLFEEGKTIAFVVDVERASPKRHVGLAENILAQGGLLVSEHAPGTSFLDENGVDRYPMQVFRRDRLQALSTAIIAIQSGYKQKSERTGKMTLCGTMHTCSFAKTYGTPIFVPEIPEDEKRLFPEKWEGIEWLLSHGARSFTRKTFRKVVFDFLEHPLSGL